MRRKKTLPRLFDLQAVEAKREFAKREFVHVPKPLKIGSGDRRVYTTFVMELKTSSGCAARPSDTAHHACGSPPDSLRSQCRGRTPRSGAPCRTYVHHAQNRLHRRDVGSVAVESFVAERETALVHNQRESPTARSPACDRGYRRFIPLRQS
jgi:hypothetical protein